MRIQTYRKVFSVLSRDAHEMTPLYFDSLSNTVFKLPALLPEHVRKPSQAGHMEGLPQWDSRCPGDRPLPNEMNKLHREGKQQTKAQPTEGERKL